MAFSVTSSKLKCCHSSSSYLASYYLPSTRYQPAFQAARLYSLIVRTCTVMTAGSRASRSLRNDCSYSSLRWPFSVSVSSQARVARRALRDNLMDCREGFAALAEAAQGCEFFEKIATLRWRWLATSKPLLRLQAAYSELLSGELRASLQSVCMYAFNYKDGLAFPDSNSEIFNYFNSAQFCDQPSGSPFSPSLVPVLSPSLVKAIFLLCFILFYFIFCSSLTA